MWRDIGEPRINIGGWEGRILPLGLQRTTLSHNWKKIKWGYKES